MTSSQNISDRREKNPGDRRIIDRFSEPKIHNNLNQISMFVKVLYIFTSVVSLYFFYEMIFIHNSIGLGIFKISTSIFTTTMLFKFNKSLHNFLANESIDNLTIVVEKQMTLWLLAVISLFILFTWNVLS